ncbi:MAG: transketolase [Pirellulales bacterium]
MPVSSVGIEQLAINTIRTLSMDAVQAANSGHPGTPMALAPVAYTLFNEVLRYDPADPAWPGRDRFVLSCGHASMLLYSLLHLIEVREPGPDGRPSDKLSVPLEDIRRFRQWGSRCPGHPENFHTPGVETTTGPLGQGAGNSVGMAIAQRWLAGHFGASNGKLFDYDVYAMLSDGDMMEGVCCEAASLAGHLKLANLCWIYDDNRITIEGETSLAFSEDVGQRFAGYGWNVLHVADANDLGGLRQAFSTFKKTNDRPTLIVVRSHIAWGAPNAQDTHGAHGAPLGAEEIKLTKRAYGWPEEAQFLVPDEVREHFRAGIGARGQQARQAWTAQFSDYANQQPALAQQWDLLQRGELPAGWDADIPTFPADAKGLATRVSSGKVLNAIAKRVPWFLGGSADLAPSTMTLMTFDGAGRMGPHEAGRNMHFGIREHGMASALNGMALSRLRPFGATFFIFSDYLRPSLRLSALMGLPVLYVFTHDSIGVGEDGPTHQPIEQLAALRAIPNLVVLRPADANEVAAAYRTVMQLKRRPLALVLTRQNLPTVDRDKLGSADGVARGAYVLADAANGKPQVLLMGTGSEVSLCLEARDLLAKENISARVVSMPSWELFEDQDAAYRESVLPAAVAARVAVETGVRQGWDKYLGSTGRFVGMSGYGASAPAGTLMKEFGFTAAHVADEAKAALEATG